MSLRARWAGGVLIGAVALGGCGGASTAGGGTAAGTATAGPTSSRPTTVRVHSASPRRPATPAPTPVEGTCPYLDAQTVAGIVGQHIVRTMVTPTTPYPGCAFYRPNAEQAAEVSLSVLGSPTQAQAKAIVVGGQAANPVNGIGDGGVVLVTDQGAVLAVSRSRTLVVVRINQRSSLEAKEIARTVLTRL